MIDISYKYIIHIGMNIQVVHIHVVVLLKDTHTCIGYRTQTGMYKHLRTYMVPNRYDEMLLYFWVRQTEPTDARWEVLWYRRGTRPETLPL